MMAGGLTSATLWLLAGAVILFGFYIGDTAPSADWIREDFDDARESVHTAGENDEQLPASARVTMLAGLSAMERLALWAHQTDGTLVGDGIECLALLALTIKPGRAVAGLAREVSGA